MNIEIEDIESIVGAVWESVVERPVWRAEQTGDFKRAGNIDIMGQWSGSVMLEVDRTSLQRAAAAMFEVDPAVVTEFQMNDALAELTNMIGGNVKCLIEHPSRLSLPSVQTIDLDDPGLGEVKTEVTLTDGEGCIRVKVLQVSHA